MARFRNCHFLKVTGKARSRHLRGFSLSFLLEAAVSGWSWERGCCQRGAGPWAVGLSDSVHS